MQGRHLLAAVVVTVVLAVTTTGCSGSSTSTASGPAGAKNWDQANAEYLGEAKTLTMPSGYTFPPQIPRDKTTGGVQNTFGDGVGRGAADQIWYCGWEQTWLHDQATSSPDAAAALATMKTLTKLSFYTVNTAPGDRHIYTDAWSRADLGDPSLIQQDVTANCQTQSTTTPAS